MCLQTCGLVSVHQTAANGVNQYLSQTTSTAMLLLQWVSENGVSAILTRFWWYKFEKWGEKFFEHTFQNRNFRPPKIRGFGLGLTGEKFADSDAKESVTTLLTAKSDSLYLSKWNFKMSSTTETVQSTKTCQLSRCNTNLIVPVGDGHGLANTETDSHGFGMLMRNGCSGFAGDGTGTAAELVTVVLSADPCRTWNVIFTFVLGNRSVHLEKQYSAKHATTCCQI